MNKTNNYTIYSQEYWDNDNIVLAMYSCRAIGYIVYFTLLFSNYNYILHLYLCATV